MKSKYESKYAKSKYDYNYGGVKEDLSTGAILGFLAITFGIIFGFVMLCITIHPY